MLIDETGGEDSVLAFRMKKLTWLFTPREDYSLSYILEKSIDGEPYHGTFDYQFWMMDMKPLKRHNGNQYLHKETPEYRETVRKKLHTYYVHLFMGVVSHGLMHYFSACHTDLVWKCFGSWLRTIRKGVVPPKRVVALAMRNTLDEFLVVGAVTNSVVKYITERQSSGRDQGWSQAV